MDNLQFETGLKRWVGRELIKVRNKVSLSIGRFDKNTKGFVIIDWAEDGDIVTLPLGTRWQHVKSTFCLMNNASEYNEKGV
jgi:hypothetical protein